MKEEFQRDVTINIPAKNNLLLQQALERINAHTELKTLWKIVNVNAMDRLAMSDHGPIHVQIVANSSLRIARILVKNDIRLSVCTGYDLDTEYGELVVVLAGLLHDLGMSINRKGHEEYSLFLTNALLKELLDFLPADERTIITSEVLHAIISHRSDGKPITLEAGILRVADALDMTAGRSRIPFSKGGVNIYSLSNQAIEKVTIEEGIAKPIEITITLNNSAGMFQIDELLKGKLKGSGLEAYIGVKATLEGDTEKKLLSEFLITE